MLTNYNCQSENDYTNALKEIVQEIALLGLWRAKFFEKAAFYGGTALRILYGLDRFSANLDFSLLTPERSFSLAKYNDAITSELQAFGFEVEVKTKRKNINTTIESAFIKANTLNQFISIAVPEEISSSIHRDKTIKIKMEVDIDPPGNFATEAKSLFLPIPFTVLTFTKEDLFAGKIHALLCRQWKSRIKGRDWYDYYWYISRGIPVNLSHLQRRLSQSGHWDDANALTQDNLLELLNNKIDKIDFTMAKKDVDDFIKDKSATDLWSKDFFHELTLKLKSTLTT